MVVANAVTEFSVKNIIASTAHIGEGSPPCITPNAITDGNSHTTVGAIAVTDVVNIGAGIALGQVLVADDDKEEDAAMIAVMAEVAHVEPIVPTLEMSLWYLTSDGSLMCIPNVDSQFLSFGIIYFLQINDFLLTFICYRCWIDMHKGRRARY